MKYHKLYIDLDGTEVTYNKVTQLLGVDPTEDDSVSDQAFRLWAYGVCVDEEDSYFDFINYFLDILEPQFANLEKLGIQKDNILFWLTYEYDQQCSMEFHHQEMKRLGESGINLNIDCITRN